MVVQDSEMRAYMVAHGCPSFLASELSHEHSQTVHWRDCEGHWYSAKYEAALNHFTVMESDG